jgi:hypothetical protein
MNLTTHKVIKGIVRSLISVCLVTVTVQPLCAAEESNDEWNFNGALYLWAADMDIEDSNGERSEVSFNDLLDNLDFGLMVHLGGQKERFGFFIDTIYLDLSDSQRDHLGDGIVLEKTELQAAILTSAATYRVVDDGQFNLDLLGGVRYLYMDVNLKFNAIDDLGEDAGTINGIVGFKGNIQLDKNWSVPFYYDVGKGESELTYQAFAGVNYSLSSFDLSAGYRYLKFKFDDDDDFGGALNHLIVKGPIIGARFYF